MTKNFDTEVRPANGLTVTALPPNVYAVSGRKDIAIFVWETGVKIDVAGRICPHSLSDPRLDPRDLVVHGKIAVSGDNDACTLQCFHRRFSWQPSGQARPPLVPNLLIYPSKLIGDVLTADLSYRPGAE